MIEISELKGTFRMSKELSNELNQIAGNDRNAVISAESHPELMARLLAGVADKLDRVIEAGGEDK